MYCCLRTFPTGWRRSSSPCPPVPSLFGCILRTHPWKKTKKNWLCYLRRHRCAIKESYPLEWLGLDLDSPRTSHLPILLRDWHNVDDPFRVSSHSQEANAKFLFTSSFILKDILGFILHGFCLTRQHSRFRGNLCCTMSGLKTGISWYDQAKMSW